MKVERNENHTIHIWISNIFINFIFWYKWINMVSEMTHDGTNNHTRYVKFGILIKGCKLCNDLEFKRI